MEMGESTSWKLVGIDFKFLKEFNTITTIQGIGEYYGR